MNILLSPHLDDAVLSLGGLLAREGAQCVVATLFAGVPDAPLKGEWDLRCGFADSAEAMQARSEENRRALGSLGVPKENIREYGHLDLQYRIPRGERRPPEDALVEALAARVAELVAESPSPTPTVFAPGLPGHPDHALLARAALNAWQAHAVDESSSRARLCFYQDIPYAFRILEEAYPWPLRHLVARADPRWWNYRSLQRAVTGGAFRVSALALPMTRGDMDHKLAAVRMYESQIGQLGHGLMKTIRDFAEAQARARALSVPYCEVVYALVP